MSLWNIEQHSYERTGKSSILMKPLSCVPWFPSSRLRPASSSLPSPRINVLCSAELTTQYAAHKALWTARGWATIINPAFQLLRVCGINTTQLSPRPCFAKGLLSIDTTITSKPQPAPWRSFSLKCAPPFLWAVGVSVLPPSWPIFKSQAEVCVSCFSRPLCFFKSLLHKCPISSRLPSHFLAACLEEFSTSSNFFSAPW